MKLKNITFGFLLGTAVTIISCSDDEGTLALEIPTEYISTSYEENVTAESTVLSELSAVSSAMNNAESNAQGDLVNATIEYPTNLQAVTLTSYRGLVADWLVELVSASNDDDGFQNPGSGPLTIGEEGGLLGTRLLDENGLELEQMVEKGSFGAALYNHALTIINSGNVTADDIDKLVEIHGTEPTFDPDQTTFAATYSRRRSNQSTQTGFFYDIRTALITAKAAAEGGFNAERDQALADYLLAWEKSNYATVIFYCNLTRTLLQSAGDDESILGDAMHAYAEGVGFTHGFRGLNNKLILDGEIDQILTLLKAPAGQTPTSYEFLNDASLLNDLQAIIDDIQSIYGFTAEEVNSFFENDPT